MNERVLVVNHFLSVWDIVIYNIYSYNSTYYMSQSVMAKYFMSRLIYFHKPELSENKA